MDPFAQPYLIGLTGGIATGKSTVAAMLAELGMAVIDADVVAREVVRRPRPAWHDIVQAFGAGILSEDGEIDRGRLGSIVFNDPGAKARLEAIVHPRVFEVIRSDMVRLHRSSPRRRIVLDIPLLIETGMHRRLPLTLLVYAPEWMQLQRLMERDGLTEAEALARIRSQMPIEAKRACTDFIVDNSGDLASTRRQVIDILARLPKIGPDCDGRQPVDSKPDSGPGKGKPQ
ncbi:MAG: dephospho-CoA kinase [Desulfobacterales bacterium]